MVDDNYNLILYYWHTASWTLIIVAVAVFLYGQYKRKSPHPLCRKCGYDLASVIRPDPQKTTKLPTPPPTCPECGHTSKKYFFKRPLKRRFIVLAVFLFLISQLVCMIPRVQRNGPIGFIPTWLLSVSTPVSVSNYGLVVPKSFESFPTWYKALRPELLQRLVHRDHSWIHIEIIEWRNSTRWFGDNNSDTLLRAFHRANTTTDPICVVSANLIAVADNLYRATDDIYKNMSTTSSVIYFNTYELPILKTRNHDMVSTSKESFELIDQIQRACAKPLDDNLTWYPATHDVPELVQRFESLRLYDVAPSPEVVRTFKDFVSLIKASIGPEIQWAPPYTFVPEMAPDIFDSRLGPSLAFATLSQVLEYLTQTSLCYSHPIHWQVQHNRIDLCPFTPLHSIAIAYDLRVSATLTNHKVAPDHPDPNYNMVQLLREKLAANYWTECRFYAKPIQERTVILAPIHIHARIQKTLPRLREELINNPDYLLNP